MAHEPSGDGIVDDMRLSYASCMARAVLVNLVEACRRCAATEAPR